MLKKNKKINKLKLTLFLVLIVLFFSPCLPAGKFFGVSEAKASGNVHGYAWFQNIGWVSLSYLGPGGPYDYGVNIEPNGIFSGYAWSPNIGWIDFSPDPDFIAYPICGYPTAPCYSACLDLPGIGQVCDNKGDYTVTGWIRSCAVFKSCSATTSTGCDTDADCPSGETCVNTCSGVLNPNSGGWDGWIKLENIWIDTSVPWPEFHYWAWGSSDIGWGTFNCSDGGANGGNICGASNYKVITTFPFPSQASAECGSAAKGYPPGSTGFGGDSFCIFPATSTPTNPLFPGVSTPYIWTNSYYSGFYWKFDPLTQVTTNYSVSNSNSYGIAVDASGNVWATIYTNGSVMKLNPSTGNKIYYTVGNNPLGIAVDASGNVWVTRFNTSGTVEKINSSKLPGDIGDVTSYTVGSSPRGVAIDASGYVWVTNSNDNSLTKIDTKKIPSDPSATTTYNNTNTPGLGLSNPYGVAVDASGNVWVTNFGNSKVTKFNPSLGTVTSYTVGSNPIGVAADASGNVWVSSYSAGTVTKIDSSGDMTSYTIGGNPRGVAPDASGNVWVTKSSNPNNVVKIDSLGVITSYTVGSDIFIFGDFTGFALKYFVLGGNTTSWVCSTSE